MQIVQIQERDIFVPDITGTGCSNSIKLKDLDFRVRCGKCLSCRRKRRSDWSLRLEHEYLFSDSAYFITLTYDDKSIPKTKEGYPTLKKSDLQLYIKRIRNEQKKYEKKVKVKTKQIRYYAVGEYGSKTRRPHYHILLFNYANFDDISPLSKQWKCTATGGQLGFTDIGTVTAASINYVTKYMHKDFARKTDKRTPPFSLMSKKPIIGQAYLDNYGRFHIENGELETRDQNGRARRLPKAYLHRLFTNKEDRVALSKASFEKFVDKNIQQYLKNVADNYKGNQIDYMKSIQADMERQIQNINKAETL